MAGEYANTCFVIMPFGKKPVDKRITDFDMIYEEVFKPAIDDAVTPEQDKLVPRRTDHDKFSSSITQDMFELIVYSRIALADISGLNANALYELGARHAVQDSGTVILRQKGHGIPFDIGTIKIFEYDHSSKAARKASQKMIAEVLTNSLEQNRLDSPLRQAINAMRNQNTASSSATAAEDKAPARGAEVQPKVDIDGFLREAEEAYMHKDWPVARTIYQVVLRLDPQNLIARMKLGLTLKNEGNIVEALEEFATLVRLHPQYGEAWREKAVMESLLIRQFGKAKDRSNAAPHAIRAFERALSLNPGDADAMSAWGGLLRRIDDEAQALAKYTEAARSSDGHPYPLLNAIKLDAKLSGSAEVRFDAELMRKAEDIRASQALREPPQDAPWSLFDLAEFRMFGGDKQGFLDTLKRGIDAADQVWQLETFRDGLKQTLIESGIDMPGLKPAMRMLDQAIRLRNDENAQ